MLKDQGSNSNVLERASEAHSIDSEWTDEKLKSYANDVISLRKDLSCYDRSSRERIFSRFAKLTGLFVYEETEENEERRKKRRSRTPLLDIEWPDEELMSYANVNDLKRDIKYLDMYSRKELLTRYAELHNEFYLTTYKWNPLSLVALEDFEDYIREEYYGDDVYADDDYDDDDDDDDDIEYEDKH